MDQRTYKPTVTLLLLVAFLVLLLAIAGPAGAAPNFTGAQNDQHVIVGVGDKINVVLPSDPNSGFRWMLGGEQSALLPHVGAIFDRTALGGQGVQTLSFVASQPGSATLRLVYARPQEGGLAPRKVFTLMIEAVRSWNDAGTVDHARAMTEVWRDAGTLDRTGAIRPGWNDAGAALNRPTTAGWSDAGASR